MKSVTQFSEQSRVVSRLFPREATGWEKRDLFSLFFVITDAIKTPLGFLGCAALTLDITRGVAPVAALAERFHKSTWPGPVFANRAIKNLQWNSLHNHHRISRSFGADSTKTFIFLFIVSFICVAAQTEMASEKLPMHTWTIIILDWNPTAKDTVAGHWIGYRNVIALYRKGCSEWTTPYIISTGRQAGRSEEGPSLRCTYQQSPRFVEPSSRK